MGQSVSKQNESKKKKIKSLENKSKEKGEKSYDNMGQRVSKQNKSKEKGEKSCGCFEFHRKASSANSQSHGTAQCYVIEVPDPIYVQSSNQNTSTPGEEYENEKSEEEKVLDEKENLKNDEDNKVQNAQGDDRKDMEYKVLKDIHEVSQKKKKEEDHFKEENEAMHELREINIPQEETVKNVKKENISMNVRDENTEVEQEKGKIEYKVEIDKLKENIILEQGKSIKKNQDQKAEEKKIKTPQEKEEMLMKVSDGKEHIVDTIAQQEKSEIENKEEFVKLEENIDDEKYEITEDKNNKGSNKDQDSRKKKEDRMKEEIKEAAENMRKKAEEKNKKALQKAKVNYEKEDEEIVSSFKGYMTKVKPDTKTKPPSLTNIGATCYLNSAFQGISACDTLVREINDLCIKYKKSDIKQLQVFKNLMAILNGCSTSQMEISRNAIFCQWNKSGQQDSYELLAYAMNQVYNELRRHKENVGEIPQRDLNRWLQEKLPMRFIIQYHIECGCSKRTESPLQSDLALHVTIPRKEKQCDLGKLVDLYFAKDPIEDYECDDCHDGKGTSRLARLCKPLPQTICIHLQRTYWNGYSMVKINNDVAFQTTLQIKSEYWSDIKPAKKKIDNHAISEEDNKEECRLEKEDGVSSNMWGENSEKSDHSSKVDENNVGKTSPIKEHSNDLSPDHEGEHGEEPVHPPKVDGTSESKEGNVEETSLSKEHSPNLSLDRKEEHGEEPVHPPKVDETSESNESNVEETSLSKEHSTDLSPGTSEDTQLTQSRSKQEWFHKKDISYFTEERIADLNATLVNSDELAGNKSDFSIPTNEGSSEADAASSTDNSPLCKLTPRDFKDQIEDSSSGEISETPAIVTTLLEGVLSVEEGKESIPTVGVDEAELNVMFEMAILDVEIEEISAEILSAEKEALLGVEIEELRSEILSAESEEAVLEVLVDDSVTEAWTEHEEGNEEEPDEVYRLVSVIVHSGTVYGGHYVIYKRVDEQWYLTNDSWVREVTESEVLRCQAYILFYEQPYRDSGPQDTV